MVLLRACRHRWLKPTYPLSYIFLYENPGMKGVKPTKVVTSLLSAVSAQVLCTLFSVQCSLFSVHHTTIDTLQCHFIRRYIRRMHVCFGVTYLLHFGQNDRDLLRANVVTRGLNRYQNRAESWLVIRRESNYESVGLLLTYWAIQRSWFARVNALCNLSRKKSQEVAAHFRADFWVGVASRCV